MKQNIIYIGGFELPDKNAAAQRVISNAKAFRDLSYETIFIGLSKDKTVCNKIENFEGFEYLNFEYPANLKQWLSYLTSIKQYNMLFSEKKIAFIIVYNFPAIALIKLRQWTFVRKIPLIADCTEWYVSTGSFLFRLIKNFDTCLRMKVLHPKLDGMIAISRYLYSYYTPRMNNVIEVPPLVDLNMDKWRPIDNPGNSDGMVNVVYAGSPGVGNKDRLDIILQSLSQIKNEGFSRFKFTVIGITEQQYVNSFAKGIPINIRENVQFKGHISHIESLNEIKIAHFNLFLRNMNLPNNAGFPTKLAESISCGTPVLTNSTSNIQDFIRVEENGFLIDMSSELSIRRGIKEAITLPLDKIQKMKANCYRSTTFNYSNYTTQFELLVRRLKIS